MSFGQPESLTVSFTGYRLIGRPAVSLTGILGYGVIGSPADSGSVSLGSSPGTPAKQSRTAKPGREEPIATLIQYLGPRRLAA